MVSYKIKIEGRVQGVWYRASTRNKAEELKLTGFVKNLRDGSVYAEVEGEEHVVAEFIGWCHEGPEYAKVTNVEVKAQNLKGYEGFRIERR